MPRGTRRQNEELVDGLGLDEDRLWIGYKSGALYKNSTLKGDAREEVFRDFLRARLPDTYGVTSGEAIDFKSQRSGQLDVIIFDKSQNAPLAVDGDRKLLPAESVLAVVEIKSGLNASTVRQSIVGADKLKSLLPYKNNFASHPPESGRVQELPRCLCTLFGYNTDLVEGEWAYNEWARYTKSAKLSKAGDAVLDRIVVLKRGMINCPAKSVLEEVDTKSGLLQHWFLDLTNFLARENHRRKPVDWQQYALRSVKGWKKIRIESSSE